jgi:hypothetical protein
MRGVRRPGIGDKPPGSDDFAFTLFAPANITAIFPHHFAPLTFLPIGNPEHAAPRSNRIQATNEGMSPGRKQPKPPAGSAVAGSSILIVGRTLLRLGTGGFNHDLILSRRT